MCQISKIAPDWATKGCHIHVGDISASTNHARIVEHDVEATITALNRGHQVLPVRLKYDIVQLKYGAGLGGDAIAQVTLHICNDDFRTFLPKTSCCGCANA